MKKVLNTAALCTGLLALGLSAGAQAYEKGDFVLRLGHITTEPHESGGDLFTAAGADTGIDAGVDSDSGLGINLLYMVHNHWGVELLAASPFRHNIKTNGGANADVASVKHLPPTLSLLYFPARKDARVQPFIGGGINYTWLYDEDINSGNGLGLQGFDVDNSWGLSGRFGVDYMIDENWSVGASAWFIDIDTKASFDNSVAGPLKANLEIDPWVYMVGMGYRF